MRILLSVDIFDLDGSASLATICHRLEDARMEGYLPEDGELYLRDENDEVVGRASVTDIG